MKIKIKLALGIGLLFVLILILAGTGLGYIHTLSNASENILEANYNSLEYSKEMLTLLDENDNQAIAIQKIEERIKKERGNITEIGEKELVDNLTQHFETFKQNPSDITIRSSIRKDVYGILTLNMNAIVRKKCFCKNHFR